MTAPDLHLIYTDYGPEYAWSLESPQIPELTGGRRTVAELLQDTNSILELAGSDRRLHDEGVYAHEQHAIMAPDGNEYLIRFMLDDDEDRTGAASRMEGAAVRGWTESEVDAQPQLVTTERLMIAVVRSDTIGWIADQLGEGGCATLGCHQGDDMMFFVPFADDGVLGAKALCTLDGIGLDRSNTFGQLADEVVAREAHDLFIQHQVKESDVAPIEHRATSA